MKKLILGMGLCAAIVLAQQQQQQPPPSLAPGESIRVIEIKQADPNSVYQTLRSVFPGISVNNRMIVVRGPNEVIGAIEEAVKRMDVPAPPPPEARAVPNVELTVHLLYGSAEGTDSVPPELETTVRQLRGQFRYKSYRVMDVQVIRGRDGQSVQTNSALPGAGSSFSNVRIQYRPRVTPGPAPHSVRLEQFQFGVRMQVYVDAEKKTTNSVEGGIITEIDAREAQRTVVGKSNVAGTEDAIFLVVSPKVIE